MASKRFSKCVRRDFFRQRGGSSHAENQWATGKLGGRDRDRTCDLIHAMDALSQLSYTPVTEQNELRMVWRTENILTNIPVKFH
jgi:hypothetical protein